ncbi:VanW family protein [uncultured Metabacillus sp.]|uniref:VanW family protein n=1 Tax=uncultured Metabacillus sp. TaxID=2860135 RepID=UPI0026125A55|nr:VanW family protein [uncultured Metabacillus sp.]
MKMILVLLLLALQPDTISEEISLTFEGEKISSIHRSEYALPPFGQSMIDHQKYSELEKKLEAAVFKMPTNATIDEHGHLVSEKMGYQLNKEKFKEAFYQSFYMKGTTSIDIPVKTIYPKVDSELLTCISSKKISQYITFFNSRNKERSHNIKLASDAINNYVVFPGETFSFNAAVGKRTVEKGYLPAPVIVRGELSEGVGGGICQVSSTLFNTVDRAGVKILERYSHSRRVPYVPPNRDATVSWYGPDFVFKNQHNQPLLIRSKVIGGQLIIIILSSDTFSDYKREVPSAPDTLPKEESIDKDNT